VVLLPLKVGEESSWGQISRGSDHLLGGSVSLDEIGSTLPTNRGSKKVRE